MAVQKGNIGITTENIFPVIKKFLYSDHEIFLREIVSNAVDATQKLRTLSAKGEFKGSLEDLKVSVKIDKEAGTLTVSDNGIGMTAEEIDRYINQIAFSGATDFLEKYKDDAATIIGHFGLGLLLLVYGVEPRGHHHAQLSRRCRSREMELRRHTGIHPRTGRKS